MSNDAITHEVTITVPEWAWDSIATGIRKLRELLRGRGGTSRVVRHGNRVSFSATGPAVYVLSSCDAFLKFEGHVNDAREEMRRSMAKRRQEEETDHMLDTLNALANGKPPWWVRRGQA
jgi:hypothetical protein